jgi:hypothetical protein
MNSDWSDHRHNKEVQNTAVAYRGGFGGFNPPPEIPKLSQIPRSVENKSVTM